MTPRDLGHIHNTRNSCWGCTSMHEHGAKTTLTWWWRSLLATTSKAGLLTVRQHSATRNTWASALITATTGVHLPKPASTDLTIKPNCPNYGPSSVITDQISNLTEQSFPEICRNELSLNDTIWALKCDKMHVFDMVDESKRKSLLTEYYLCMQKKFMKQKLIHFACVNY